VCSPGFVLEVNFRCSDGHLAAEDCAMFDCGRPATTCITVWNQHIVYQEDHGCDRHEAEIAEQIKCEWDDRVVAS
jgi:hypothetical protein